MYNSSDFLFVPLGGSGEIGMNANLYHYEGSWLMVDLGISFPDDSMPGIDVVLPDLSFIEARREQLAGLVLTHGHEDHLGAIPYMWSKLGCPVYGSAFTLALLRRKLAENNNPRDIPLIELSPGMVEDIGAFSVEMVGMAHSIPDPTSLAIRCDAGTVLHTGDWKFDESPGLGTDTDSNRLAEIGDEGVLAMIGDSTNAMVEGRTASEAEAEAGLRKVIAEAKGRVAISCFSSNVARIQSIIRAAQANDRSVAVVGRAIRRAISAAQEVGYLRDLPDFVAEDDIELLLRDLLHNTGGAHRRSQFKSRGVDIANRNFTSIRHGQHRCRCESQHPCPRHQHMPICQCARAANCSGHCCGRTAGGTGDCVREFIGNLNNGRPATQDTVLAETTTERVSTTLCMTILEQRLTLLRHLIRTRTTLMTGGCHAPCDSITNCRQLNLRLSRAGGFHDTDDFMPQNGRSG